MTALGALVQPLRRLQGRWAPAAACGPVGAWAVDGVLRFAQLERGADGGIHARAQGEVPLAVDGAAVDTDALSAAFAAIRRDHGVRGRRVVSVLPDTLARIFTLSYTADGRGDDTPALMRAVGDRLDGDLREWVIDRVRVRTGPVERQRLSVVIAARRPDVIACAEGWRRAGAELVALEVAPTAVRRLMNVLGEHREHNILVLEMRGPRCDISLYSGRRLQFHQTLAFGADWLVAAIAGALGTEAAEAAALLRTYGTAGVECGDRDALRSGARHDDGEDVCATIREIIHPGLVELVDQINRALMFAASENRGESVEEIRLLGDPAVWPGFAVTLERLLLIRVDTFAAALRELGDGSGIVLDDPVATGLALRTLLDADGH